jgi:hypothetical protein
MRRKILQHFANVFCRMFVGWRMGEDVDVLSKIHHGQIYIDVLRGQASLAAEQPLNICIAGKLQAWFASALEKHNIPIEAIREAKLLVDIGAVTIERKRATVTDFHFDCHSVISTDEKTYQSSLKEKHAWHRNKN